MFNADRFTNKINLLHQEGNVTRSNTWQKNYLKLRINAFIFKVNIVDAYDW